MPYPSKDFAEELSKKLKIDSFKLLSEYLQQKIMYNDKPVLIDSILSPSLDSINFWFLKSSVNLFGEAFLKAMVLNVEIQRQRLELRYCVHTGKIK